MNELEQPAGPTPRRRFTGLQVLGISLAVMLITIAVTGVVVWRYAFPSRFKAVELNEREQRRLDDKIRALGIAPASDASPAEEPLEPERYTEEGASRDVRFSEKELNALLARNTNLASRLAIDLSDDLASAKLLIPVDPAFPILGGKTLRVNAGVELAFRAGQPVAILRGVSLMGIPLPNAWLGNLKNVDLVAEFGGDRGFWRSFAAGIDYVEVRESMLHVRLKE